MLSKIAAMITCICGVLMFTSGVCVDNSEFNVVQTINADNSLDDFSAEFIEFEQPEQEIINLGVFKLTAYCACETCCGKTNAITASGVKATAGITIAADTNRLPFGTRILIDNHEYTVQDRGGAIKGNRIDIYFNTHQEAINFGVQYKEIYKIKDYVNF